MIKNKVLKAGVGYTIGNYMLKGLSFISVPIYTRLLSTSSYGLFNNFLTYESIFFVIIGCAIHGSYKSARYKYKLEKEGAKKGKDYYSYVSTSVVFILFCTFIWLLLANMLVGVLSDLLDMNQLSINLLIIFSAASALIICFNVDVSLDYNYKKFLFISGFNAIGTILISILLLLTIFAKEKYMGMIIGAALPTILASLYVIFYFFKRAMPANFIPFLKWGIKYSLPIIPHGLSQVILNQFDRIMITKMVSASATGVYSFAYNIYSILTVTFNSLDNVWSPWFYEKMQAKEYKRIKTASTLYISLMFIFTAIIILVSPELVMILGQKSYWAAKYAAIPVVGGGYFAFLYTIPATVEYYHGKTIWLAIGTTTAAIINIILNYIFIPRIGYIAAAYSTLATYMLYFIFHYYIAKKIQGYNLFSNWAVLACSIGVLIICLISRLFINIILLRWILAIIMFCITIVSEEKRYGLIRKKVDTIK